VVVLVDEYDKPITEFLDDLPRAKDNRELLRGFFAALKGRDRLLRFVLLTGVSKFGKLSVFSGLNHLRDITLYPQYGSLLGYTGQEIEQYFGNRLQAWAAQQGLTYQALVQRFTHWYNGYSWTGRDHVYNPWSVMSALEVQRTRAFWHATGAPSFLVRLLKHEQVFLPDLEGLKAGEELLESTGLEDVDVLSLLWQTGYLSIKAVTTLQSGDERYTLGFPNKEVRQTLLVSYLADGQRQAITRNRTLVQDIYEALANNDLPAFFTLIASLLAMVPYHQYKGQGRNPKEAFFHSLVFMAIKLSGHDTHAEVATSGGRIDAVLQTDTHVYIFEFKLTTPEEALAQIKANSYAAPYLNQGKTVVAVGAAFDADTRSLKGWLTDEVV